MTKRDVDLRRGVFTLLALCLLAVGRLSAATFEEANQLFDQGKFAEAKTAYEALRAGGQTSANLFYNLGNAEFRLGSPGRAVLNYERALALEPGHKEARLNLDFVRKQTGARVPERTWVEQALLPWSVHVYTLLAAAGAWVLLFTLLAIFFGRARESILAWSVAVLALAAAAYGGLGVWSQWDRRALAIVVAKDTAAHGQPAERTDVIQSLPGGSRVRIVRERSGWVYCDLPGRAPGWIPQEALETIFPKT